MKDKKRGSAKRARRDKEAALTGATGAVIAAMHQLDIDPPLDDDELVLDTFPAASASVADPQSLSDMSITSALSVITAKIYRSAGLPSFGSDCIIRPAVLFKGHVYSKEGAYRHHEILAAMYAIFGGLLEGEEEGFLTAGGSFASAREAKELVRLLQQATVRNIHDYRLLTEELWA